MEVKTGGCFLVAPGNELKEQVCALNVHGKVADLVDDKYSVLGQNLEFIWQAVLKMSPLELLNELVSIHVVSREAVLSRRKAQCRGQLGLAHTWWTEKHYILAILKEANGG